MTPPDRIKLLIVDNHPVVLDGLTAMFARQREFEVVGTARNGREAVEQAVLLAPHVVLMDLQMPVMNGVEAMRRIGQEAPQVHCIALTTFGTDDYIFDAIQAGAKGYLLKDVSREELFQAVRAVYRGESSIQPKVASRVLDWFAQMAHRPPRGEGLSPREVEVLQLMARGQSNKAIAASLAITGSTVKTHVASIFEKLEVGDRTSAVTKALQRGLIKL